MTNSEFKLREFYQKRSVVEVERESNKNEKIFFSDDPDDWEYLYDPNDNDFLSVIRRGDYHSLFEKAESYFERKPTVYDYHNLYVRILEELYIDIIADCIQEDKEPDNKIIINNEKSDDELTDDEKTDIYKYADSEESKNEEYDYEGEEISFEDWKYAYEKEQLKLDTVFDEFASKIETSAEISVIENHINKLLEEKKKPTYIEKLEEKGLLSTDGKKRTTAGLPKIVEALYSMGVEQVTPKLLKQFRQDDGQEYSKHSLIKYAKAGKPDSDKKKIKKKIKN